MQKTKAFNLQMLVSQKCNVSAFNYLSSSPPRLGFPPPKGDEKVNQRQEETGNRRAASVQNITPNTSDTENTDTKEQTT